MCNDLESNWGNSNFNPLNKLFARNSPKKRQGANKRDPSHGDFAILVDTDFQKIAIIMF